MNMHQIPHQLADPRSVLPEVSQQTLAWPPRGNTRQSIFSMAPHTSVNHDPPQTAEQTYKYYQERPPMIIAAPWQYYPVPPYPTYQGLNPFHMVPKPQSKSSDQSQTQTPNQHSTHNNNYSAPSSAATLLSTPSLETLATQSSTATHSKRGLARDNKQSQTNFREKQLVDLAHRMIQVPLEEMAMLIKGSEEKIEKLQSMGLRHARPVRAAESEKKQHRQLLAMVVLLRSVEVKESAVSPRNRIFNSYVELCKEHDIPPISNASLGKLVKLLFPSVKTRRLGIRGFSKYHYCGIKLISDPDCIEVFASPATDSTVQLPPLYDEHEDYSELSIGLNLDPQLFRHFFEINLKYTVPSMNELYQMFPKTDHEKLHGMEQVYSAHCQKLFQYIKFMEVQHLLDEMESLSSQLSIEQKSLLSYSDVVSWILKCDDELYGACIKYLSKTVFQSAPDQVHNQLKNINVKFMDALKSMKLPSHVLKEKELRAAAFLKITSRLSRVILAATNFAGHITHSSIVTNLLSEWKMLTLDTLVDRDIHCEQKRDITSILRTDIVFLFNDLQKLSYHDDNIKDNVVQLLSLHISKIPSKFEGINPRVFLLVSNQVIDSIMRQLSIEVQVGNFSIWWSLSCWLNEFFNFLAEFGGFIRFVSDNSFEETPV
ncbi:hypothetical protein OGAPHI_007294 [Ogataea philodendri]|uniref:RFX-type winged-helix domain-containing protein n=1 Tax=Ogataea philodendri TaxID=1378263 RepID=A0A9P8NW23_9ASCO|nr:uncharacterized protein OGAPHI_007294 [Ogataea philodendri]KAH3660089.1 hypothetical protein OGAPHI_007294 [Ogataea philodendri]